jgi:hypothetical protein
MSILNFLTPSDSKILKDINNSNNSLKFIGLGSVCQNISETLFVRLIKFNNEENIKKVVYKKDTFSWRFSSLEVVNF